jgi:hypothetical protein
MNKIIPAGSLLRIIENVYYMQEGQYVINTHDLKIENNYRVILPKITSIIPVIPTKWVKEYRWSVSNGLRLRSFEIVCKNG